jgi:hypothetical protein
VSDSEKVNFRFFLPGYPKKEKHRNFKMIEEKSDNLGVVKRCAVRSRGKTAAIGQAESQRRQIL